MLSKSNLDFLIYLTYWHCRVALAYIKRASQGSMQVLKDECIMQKEIAKWFPHTGVSQMIFPSANHLENVVGEFRWCQVSGE
jgi:hypothetical protein